MLRAACPNKCKGNSAWYCTDTLAFVCFVCRLLRFVSISSGLPKGIWFIFRPGLLFQILQEMLSTSSLKGRCDFNWMSKFSLKLWPAPGLGSFGSGQCHHWWSGGDQIEGNTGKTILFWCCPQRISWHGFTSIITPCCCSSSMIIQVPGREPLMMELWLSEQIMREDKYKILIDFKVAADARWFDDPDEMFVGFWKGNWPMRWAGIVEQRAPKWFDLRREQLRLYNQHWKIYESNLAIRQAHHVSRWYIKSYQLSRYIHI